MSEAHLDAPTRLNAGLDGAARFGLAHLASGCGMGALIVTLGQALPGGDALVVIGWSLGLAAVGLAILPRITGRLDWSEAASSVALTLLACALASVTGGLSSPFLIWLLAAPIQTAVSGRRSAIIFNAALTGIGILVLAWAHIDGHLPVSILPKSAATMLSIVTAASALGGMLWAMLDALAPKPAQNSTILYLEDPICEGAPDVIMRLDAANRIKSVNAAAQRVLGISPQEIEGLHPGVLVHIAEYQTMLSALAELGTGSDPVSANVRMRRKDGSFLWMEWAARRDGVDAVAVLRDVTTRKAQEQALIDDAQAAIEQSKSKSRFLANMSHELRTPLNAIIGFSDMIRQEVFGPVGHGRYREYAGHIHASGQHLVDLISDLLDMSKIEAGKFKLALKPVDVAEIVEEAIEMLKLQADEAGVGITAHMPRDLPAPMADRRAVKQIMLNLLSNAIKFTPAQGRIVAAARREDGNVVLEVRDTGVGIPEADLNRIGKPFEQAGDPMRDMHKGTGLGLSLVAALANLHGGRMQIDSAPGDGTTVKVTLPVDPLINDDANTVVFPEKFRVGGKG